MLRSLGARALLERVGPALASHGITRVADVTGLDRLGIPVVMVTRPNGRTLSVAQGKGITLDDARASGVMEAIETDVAELWDPEAVVASRDALPGASVDPAWLRPHPGARLHGGEALPWVRGTDLATGVPTWVPLERCRLDGTVGRAGAPRVLAQDSNGLASGAERVDALIHALCEVLERDARAHVIAGSAPIIDGDALEDAALSRAIEACRRAGVEVELTDLTRDGGVPVIGATLVDLGRGRLPPLRAMRGHGCHPDPAGAAIRALTEAAQSRLTVISGARDDLDPRHWLPVGGRRPQPPATDGHRPASVEVGADLDGVASVLVGAALAAGARQLVEVDMSPPGAPYAVVRVIAPGLAGVAEVAVAEGSVPRGTAA